MILFKCIDEAQDYFARLGGSGRYEGFCEWHPFALVLITLLELKEPSAIIQRIKIEQSLPDKLWNQTDGLPSFITRLLVNQVVNREAIEEYVLKSTEYLTKVCSPRELSDWMSFVESIRKLLGIK
jgi:hypothetical protein